MSTASAILERVNLNDLSLEDKKALMKSVYNSTSYFQTLFKAEQIDIDCKAPALALRHEIERLLLEKNLIQAPVQLEKLHEVLSDEMKAYNFNDGVNKISTYFYETDEQFQKTFYQFIAFVRQHVIQESFYFQGTPTIRIHCPNAENSNHYPRYHSDISYGHPPEEINIWLPLTELLTGHSFRAMSVAASKQALEKFDFDWNSFIHSAINDKAFSAECDATSSPVTTELGKMFAFDSRCVHTGEPMKQHTRISMDIRVLPLSQYEKMTIQYQGSGRRRILFEPGHCYHEQHSDFFLDKGI